MYKSRLLYRRRNKEKGLVAAEFAVAFPILLSVFMVMMFLMDLMMVKQEITNIGHSAMRHCTKNPNATPAELGSCVMGIVRETQRLPGSNERYSCDVRPTSLPDMPLQVLELDCTYEGFAPIGAIFELVGIDMTNFRNLTVPVFFPN